MPSRTPVEKVISGQRFEPAAETWNSFVDAANDYRQRTNSVARGSEPRPFMPGIVKLKNAYGITLSRYDGAMLGEPIIAPGSDSATLEFKQVVAMSSANAGCPVIVLEPIQNGTIGDAISYGAVQARLNINNASHGYASVPATGGPLESANAGDIRIIWKESGTGLKNAVVYLGGWGSAAGTSRCCCGDSEPPEGVESVTYIIYWSTVFGTSTIDPMYGECGRWDPPRLSKTSYISSGGVGVDYEMLDGRSLSGYMMQMSGLQYLDESSVLQGPYTWRWRIGAAFDNGDGSVSFAATLTYTNAPPNVPVFTDGVMAFDDSVSITIWAD